MGPTGQAPAPFCASSNFLDPTEHLLARDMPREARMILRNMPLRLVGDLLVCVAARHVSALALDQLGHLRIALSRLTLLVAEDVDERLEESLAKMPLTRIQLCGRLAAEIEGRRIEADLPGRQGRLLFVYLVANRDRVIGREELIEALWPERAPPAVGGALRALVSKVRRAVGQDALGL